MGHHFVYQQKVENKETSTTKGGWLRLPTLNHQLIKKAEMN